MTRACLRWMSRMSQVAPLQQFLSQQSHPERHIPAQRKAVFALLDYTQPRLYTFEALERFA